MRGYPKSARSVTWDAPDVYWALTRNVLFYDGPSQLDGTPIVAIATAQNGNRKIGHMMQLWIMARDVSPIDAVKQGLDASVCGACVHRGDGRGNGRSCYVEYWRAVSNVWQARAKARRLDAVAFAQLCDGKQLRIGAYGDPVAVPMAVWAPLLSAATGWTAYTHQWKQQELALPYQRFCMASVDDEFERLTASTLGWRTYRVRPTTDDRIMAGEIVCPASEEGGHRTVCATCELCRGATVGAVPLKDIVIAAHSRNAKWFRERPA